MKISIPLQVFFIILCVNTYGQSVDSLKYKSLCPYDFNVTLLKTDKAFLIDVREFFEYKKSRIMGAVNIPSSGNLEFAGDSLGKELSLFLYCTSGFRSKKVSEKFSTMGFANVFNLEGGFKGWKRDGFPVERKKMRKGEREKR